MMFDGVLGCGTSFRRALTREPLDVQQKLLAIRARIQQGQAQQAYRLLENTECGNEMKARLYESIFKTAKDEIRLESKKKAMEEYLEAGQQARARYLSHLM